MMSAAEKKRLCFVVGPIGAEDSDARIHADWLLELIIRPVMASFPEYILKRADQDHRPGLIDAQLINDLLTADLVIADLSGLNPNAFYEIGIRHMVQKPIIHMQLADENIPFDISLYRAIKFSRLRPRDFDHARASLAAQVQAVHESDYKVENPVTNARGRFQLETHATPQQQVLIDQMRAFEARLGLLEKSGVVDPTPEAASRMRRPPLPSLMHSVGDRVFHQKFGDGKVVGLDGNKVAVDFAKAGRKYVVDAFLENLSGEQA